MSARYVFVCKSKITLGHVLRPVRHHLSQTTVDTWQSVVYLSLHTSILLKRKWNFEKFWLNKMCILNKFFEIGGGVYLSEVVSNPHLVDNGRVQHLNMLQIHPVTYYLLSRKILSWRAYIVNGRKVTLHSEYADLIFQLWFLVKF